MHIGYKRLVCGLCAAWAALCMAAAPVEAEVFVGQGENMGCLYAKDPAEDSEAKKNNTETKPTVMERAASDLPLYFCIGGGGAFVLVTICLLAEERKK